MYKVNGNKVNQHRPINISYRKRGNRPRSIMITKNRRYPIIKVQVVKSLAVSIHIPRTEPYSPKKINTNGPPPYSILNPLIISLSPSAKSNGARFDSARILTQNMGRKKNIGLDIPHLKPALDKNPPSIKIRIERITS
jgi:hypothetical protein